MPKHDKTKAAGELGRLKKEPKNSPGAACPKRKKYPLPNGTPLPKSPCAITLVNSHLTIKLSSTQISTSFPIRQIHQPSLIAQPCAARPLCLAYSPKKCMITGQTQISRKQGNIRANFARQSLKSKIWCFFRKSTTCMQNGLNCENRACRLGDFFSFRQEFSFLGILLLRASRYKRLFDAGHYPLASVTISYDKVLVW